MGQLKNGQFDAASSPAAESPLPTHYQQVIIGQLNSANLPQGQLSIGINRTNQAGS